MFYGVAPKSTASPMHCGSLLCLNFGVVWRLGNKNVKCGVCINKEKWMWSRRGNFTGFCSWQLIQVHDCCWLKQYAEMKLRGLAVSYLNFILLNLIFPNWDKSNRSPMPWGFQWQLVLNVRARVFCPLGQEHPSWWVPSLSIAACLTAISEVAHPQLTGAAVPFTTCPPCEARAQITALQGQAHWCETLLLSPYSSKNNKQLLIQTLSWCVSIGLWRHGKNNNSFPLGGEILPFEP